MATIPDEDVRTRLLKHFQQTGFQYHLLPCTAKEAIVDLTRFRRYVDRCTTEGRVLTKDLVVKGDLEAKRKWGFCVFEPKSDVLSYNYNQWKAELVKHGMNSVTDLPDGSYSGNRRPNVPNNYGVYVEFSP